MAWFIFASIFNVLWFHEMGFQNKFYQNSSSLSWFANGVSNFIKYHFCVKCYISCCPASMCNRADSRFAASQWEISLQSNTISHWLGANLQSALCNGCSHSVVYVSQVKMSLTTPHWFMPSQWEMVFLCNNVSHWLDAIIESALIQITEFTRWYTLRLSMLNCFANIQLTPPYNLWHQSERVYSCKIVI